MEDGGVELKRGKRRRLTTNAINRQKRIAKLSGIPVRAPHRLSKMHATNCGDPNCAMCGNPRKFFNEPTIQEKKFLQSYPRDWIE